MDKYTIQIVQRAVKQKARKVGRPIALDGECIAYCIRCLKSNYEVEGLLFDPFFSICYECVDNLAIFVGYLRDAERQKLAQTQSESDEGESSQDRQGAWDEGC